MQTTVHARTVLGDAERSFQLASTTTAADAAMLFASAFQLPTDTIEYALHDEFGVFLEPVSPVGFYGDELFTTLIPKAHLG